MNNAEPQFVYFLTGASGVGKTTSVDRLKKKYEDRDDVEFLHFDSIGVPSADEMTEQFGSPTKWQEAMTFKWIDKILSDYRSKVMVVIEGQVNLEFIREGFSKHGFQNYKIIHVDCSDDEMTRRLTHDRQQPELVTDDMKNWLKFLRNQAQELGVTTIDTTGCSLEDLDKIVEEMVHLA